MATILAKEKRTLAVSADCINDDCRPDSPPWERYHITTRGTGAADALQVSLIGFAAFENDFCGHEQERAKIHRGTFSADNPLKFSEKTGFCGLHGTSVEPLVEGFKMTGGCYQSAGFTL